LKFAPLVPRTLRGEQDCRKACKGAPGKGPGSGPEVVCFGTFAVGFTLEQEVLVSKLYPKGSCTYDATFAHELLHWQDNDDIYKDAARALRAALEEQQTKLPIATPCAPAHLKDADQRERYEDFVIQSLAQVIRRAQRETKDAIRRAIAKRDAAFNYAEVHQKC